MRRVSTVCSAIVLVVLSVICGVETANGEELILVTDPDVYVWDSAGHNTTSARIGEDLTIWVNLKNVGDTTSPPLKVDLCLDGVFRVDGNLETKHPCYRLTNVILSPGDVFRIGRDWNTGTDFAGLGYFVAEGQTYDITVLWGPEDEALEDTNNSGVQYKLDALRIPEETNQEGDATILALVAVVILIVSFLALAYLGWKRRGRQE